MENLSVFLWRKNIARTLLSFIFLAGCLTVFMAGEACAAKPPAVKAVWKQKKSLLVITGTHWGKKQPVTVSDTSTGAVLGSPTSGGLGKWKLRFKDPATVPCRVRAESGTNFSEVDVLNAPSSCGGGGGGGGQLDPSTLVFAFNDLGMHCYDKDFSVFAVLPLFNVVHAQVVRKGTSGTNPQILGDTQAGVFYSAVADNSGSINTTSMGKTNFWDYAQQLFGLPAPLPVDTGLLGAKMPGPNNTVQKFSGFDPAVRWFSAPGIPITDIDDALQKNSYPLMRMQSVDPGTMNMSQPTFTVLPVSDEMHCSDCHATNGIAANDATKAKYGIQAWSASGGGEIQYRENILILHGAIIQVDLMAGKPVLCFSCHYSPALDLNKTGPQGDQVGKPLFSAAMHRRHGSTIDGTTPDAGHPAIIPDAGIGTCYRCHPGTTTQCLRGAMGTAGIICQDCHGGLLAVAGVYGSRTPWLNEPKCQSCHTGDAVSHLGASIRGTKAYNPADPAAAPIIAVNKRFAETDNTLYRDSFGHGGMACEACHNGPHAIWPVGNPNANDNIAAVQLQGHIGTIIECTTCHAGGPPLTTNGPHGLHNINDSNWNESHRNFYRQNPQGCQACHGLALEGTVLSRAAADRQLQGDDNRNVFVAKGTQISCTLCHENPLTGDD